MNLIIDIGNTRTKYSVFDKTIEVYSDSDTAFTLKKVKSIIDKHNQINKCIVSATGHMPEGSLSTLRKSIDFCMEFNQQTPLPFTTEYKTLTTLGLDRLAGVAGANFLYPDNNVLIIDTGTAITYDLKSDNGKHLGGNISPGMQMRFNALHSYTEKLPLVEPKNDITLIGLSTEEAIQNGVVNGILTEIEGFIESLEKNYNNLTLILTGGDALFFVNKLKKTIFVVRNLVSTGLNTILLHNVEKI